MSQNPTLLFSVDRSDARPIFEQLCDTIRRLIHNGVFNADTRLPATRTLAQELAISRSTVVTAYEQLVAEGYLQSKPGAGYRVCGLGETELPGRTKVLQDNNKSAGPPRQISRLKEQLKEPLKEQPDKLLTPSLPDMRLFPYRQWAKTIARICRTRPESMLTGSEAVGDQQLRQAIAHHVREWRGLEVSADQVIVTAGATDALAISFRILLQPGHNVGLEDPGYRPILRQVTGMGLNPVFLRVDSEGASLPDSPDSHQPEAQLEADAHPDVVVLTPSHQYPLGNTMTPQRRWEYIHWAHKHQRWIIEDDYDSEFRYIGRPIPAMAGLDQLQRTLYIGSFAKLFSNTLRLGYLIVPEPLIAPVRKILSDYSLKAGLMPQPALAEFIHSGDFYRYLRRVRKIYSERNKYLVQQLQTRFNHFGHVQDYSAGMKLVFHLNQAFNDVDIVARTHQAGLALEALSTACHQRTDCNGLIMGFAGYTEREIHTALDQLLSVLCTCQDTAQK